MVLQRTIENLRDRPKDERRAVAFGIAVAVMGVLVVVWGVFFFRTVGTLQVQQVGGAYDEAVAGVQQAVGGDGWVSEAPPRTPTEMPTSYDSLELVEGDPLFIEEEAPLAEPIE